MKSFRILTTLGFSALLALAAHAQMSTFPTPPPLPSPSASAPEPAAPSSSPTGLSSTPPARSSSGAPALTAGTLTSMEALDNKTALQDGDTISFRVIEDRDDPVQRIVTDTGEVDFPYIGPVKV
jgi:protein involved in polysaccharide export with SLBB domain